MFLVHNARKIQRYDQMYPVLKVGQFINGADIPLKYQQAMKEASSKSFLPNK